MDGKDTEKSGSEGGTGGKQNATEAQGKGGGSTQAKSGGKQAKAGGAGRAGGRKGAGAIQGQAGGQQQQTGNGQGATDAIQFLKQQHATIRELISACEAAEESDKSQSAQELLKAWSNHSLLEEEIVVPEAEQAGLDQAVLGRLQVERDLSKVLAAEVMYGDDQDQFYQATLAVLTKLMTDIIAEEEKPRSGVLALIKNAGLDLNELGSRLQQEAEELEAEGDDFDLPAPKALRVIRSRQSGYGQQDERRGGNGDRGYGRSRYDEDDDRRGGGRMPDRDQYGRFMSEDDEDDRQYSRSRSSSGRDYEDDDRRRSGRSREMPERDEYGRFMNDDDDRGGRSRSSRGRDDNDDGRYSRGRGSERGQGGWFGDSEGHSEAARRGWEEREGGSSSGRSSRRDDDEGRSSRSGAGGRGQGGWFGDSEGHSEAARRGWEERESSGSRGRSSRDDDYDYRSSRSRGREDDDRRSSRNSRY